MKNCINGFDVTKRIKNLMLVFLMFFATATFMQVNAQYLPSEEASAVLDAYFNELSTDMAQTPINSAQYKLTELKLYHAKFAYSVVKEGRSVEEALQVASDALRENAANIQILKAAGISSNDINNPYQPLEEDLDERLRA